MRTTIIPAQITTVEDKIAGSLNFAQILLLMVPILWGTAVYALFSPVMKVAPYKLNLFLFITILCLALAFRIKEKIVAQWLGILLRYYLRPKYYLANKNDLTERIVDFPLIKSIKNIKEVTSKSVTKKQNELSVKELIKLEQMMNSRKLAISFRFGGKR